MSQSVPAVSAGTYSIPASAASDLGITAKNVLLPAQTCLWFANASPAQLRTMPELMKRVEAVKTTRLQSSREATRKLAAYPTLFGEDRQPKTRYLAIPSISSERRQFIPIGFLEPEIIASNKLVFIPNAEIFHFGILTSTMHMAWTKLVTGRLESRFQYSNKLVYNNFPWPSDATEAQRVKVEEAAQAVLDAREIGRASCRERVFRAV